MSSTTRLLVLGVVQIFQPVHGYDVRRELVSWQAQDWASIKPGSIYNALKSLTREGLLEVVGTDQVGGRPERTTYQLTSEGGKEFRKLLRHEWWTVRWPIDPMMAALSFIGYVPRAEAISALEHRTAQIHGLVQHLELATSDIDGVDTPYHVREMHGLLVARINSEVGWSRILIERLRQGEYVTGDETAAELGAPQATARSKPSSTAAAGLRQKATHEASRPARAGDGSKPDAGARRQAAPRSQAARASKSDRTTPTDGNASRGPVGNARRQARNGAASTSEDRRPPVPRGSAGNGRATADRAEPPRAGRRSNGDATAARSTMPRARGNGRAAPARGSNRRVRGRTQIH